MAFRLDVFHHAPGDDELRRLSGLIESLRGEIHHMAGELDALTREVAENKSVMESAATLLTNLSAQIRALATDPAKLQALADSLDANSAALAAAVAANTPADEPPAPAPGDEV
jgi:peptidoglycan hydrolase CwlO-like protein